MAGIGPQIPAHLLSKRSTTPTEDDEEAGPSLPVGPVIPPEVLRSASARPPIAVAEDEDDEDEDDYAPALPPDLAASRTSHNQPGGSSKRVQGPTMPSMIQRRPNPSYDDDDDDYGPMPLPAGVSVEEKSGVREFLEKEERRRKLVEEAAKPKALQREEWMLVPPSSSDLLGSIDPTKLTKPRQFSRSTAPSRNVDSSLWTETPAERQQRVADEVAGKRRRAANADPDAGDESAELEARKRRRRDEEIRKGVDDYTKKNRGESLLEQRAKGEKEAKEKSGEADGPPGIWDHGRDMALSGRLMDEGTRDKYIREAKGLGDRFGTGKSGGFL